MCIKTCTFNVYASWEKEKATYVVGIVIDHHKHSRNMLKNRQCKSSWLSKYYLLKSKKKSNWSIVNIVNQVKQEFGIRLHKWVAYRVREVPHTLLYGSMKDHYCNLGMYIKELKRSNAASTFIMEIDPNIVKKFLFFKDFLFILMG